MNNLNKKKILITGGNSKIGNDLVNFFFKKNIVTSTYRKKKINLINKNFFQIKYDLNKQFRLDEKFDHLIHCASATPYKTKEGKKMITTNLNGFKKILNSKCTFKSVLLLSTMSVYGKIKNRIIKENIKPLKVSEYGYSKLLMERFLIKFKKKNINYLILRLPGIVGNYKSDNNFLNNVILKFLKGEDVIFKNPEKFFNNVIHTETLSKIIESFFLKNEPYKKIFNMCSSKPIKLVEIMKFIKKKLKSSSKITIDPFSNHSFYISSKKCKKFGIKIINTKNSIAKTLDYHLKSR